MANPRSKIKRLVTIETKNLICGNYQGKEDADKSYGQLYAVFDGFKIAHEEFIEHIEDEAQLEASNLYFDEVEKCFVDARDACRDATISRL